MEKLSGATQARLALVLTFAATAAIAGPVGLADADPTCDTSFTGGYADDPKAFEDADNWDAGVPDATKHGCIEGTHDVELDTGAVVGGLTIGEDASLTILSWPGPWVMVNGVLLNHGLLATTGTGMPTIHIAGGSFTNEGTLSFASDQTFLNLDGTFTNTATGTLHVGGSGWRGLYVSPYYHTGDPAFVNEGTIVADKLLEVFGSYAVTLAPGSSVTGTGSVLVNAFNDGYVDWAGGDLGPDGGFAVGDTTLTIAGVGTGTMAYVADNIHHDTLLVEGTVNDEQVLELGGITALTGDLANDGTIVLDEYSRIDLEGHMLTNTGTITVPDGVGSGIRGGDAEAGTLDNRPDGTVDVGVDAYWSLMDIDLIQAGTLTIDGVASKSWGNASFEVGSSTTGTGELAIFDDDLVEWKGGTIDLDDGAAVRYGPLVIAGVGSGTIQLHQEASVEGTVGEAQALELLAEWYDGVTLTGDLVNDGSITIASSGATASMEIGHAGHTLTNNATFVAAEGDTQVFGGPFVNSTTGTVTVAEGTLFASRPGTGSTFRNEGTMVVDGSMVAGHGFATTGTASGDGGIRFLTGARASGVGDFLIDVVVYEARLAPGQSPGVIEVDDFTLTGQLDIELGGAAPGEFDQVLAAGAVVLSPNAGMELALVDGYELVECDTFDVVIGASRTGTIAPWFFNGDELDDELEVVLVYGADRVTLVVVPTGTTDVAEACPPDETPTTPTTPTTVDQTPTTPTTVDQTPTTPTTVDETPTTPTTVDQTPTTPTTVDQTPTTPTSVTPTTVTPTTQAPTPTTAAPTPTTLGTGSTLGRAAVATEALGVQFTQKPLARTGGGIDAVAPAVALILLGIAVLQLRRARERTR